MHGHAPGLRRSESRLMSWQSRLVGRPRLCAAARNSFLRLTQPLHSPSPAACGPKPLPAGSSTPIGCRTRRMLFKGGATWTSRQVLGLNEPRVGALCGTDLTRTAAGQPLSAHARRLHAPRPFTHTPPCQMCSSRSFTTPHQKRMLLHKPTSSWSGRPRRRSCRRKAALMQPHRLSTVHVASLSMRVCA